MNGLTELRIGDKVIGLKFGMQAARMFMGHLILDFERLNGGHYNERDVANILFAGYTNYCTVNDLVPEYKLGYFIGLVEDNKKIMAEEFKRVAKVFEESEHTKELIGKNEAAVDEVKKKKKRTGTL